MNIDITSFFFNSSIEGGTATCAWGTSIGQNATKECRVEDEKPGVLELLTGMVYKSCADTSKLDISAGSSQRDLLICSIFDKVFVNGIRLEGCKFILTLVRELSPSHKGRLIISYPSYAKYDNEPINKNTMDKMATAIGCNATGCWFVHDISIRNQDELHFSSVVVDPEKPQVYTGSSSTRSKYWQSLVSDNKAYNLAELGTILRNMYDNAENNKQVAMLYVFVFQYGQYLVDVFKSKEIIEAAGLNGSYSTEIDKAYNVYRYVTKKKLQLFFNDNCCDGYRLDLKHPLQTIFYGAPGTGKSHKVKEVTETLPKSDVFRTTFHPDSDYSTFVGCYKPKMVKAPIRDGSGHEITSACEDEKKRIAYEYEPQAFLKAYVRAYETNEPVFLVIEEINRGNCAQIFGDMFQLLDRNENGESDYAIKPETAIQEFLNDKLKDCDIEDEAIKSGEEMRLPANLHIWATMNTSDQSLFPIDSAFKRRWDWKYMPINTQKESWSIKVNGTEYSWSNFLEKINAEIDSVTHSEDKKLGFYFCKAENGVISAERFVSKVLFYIWNDVFKDYGFEKDIFNDTEGKLSFGKFYQENGEIREDKVALFLKNLGVDEHTSTSEKPGDAEEGNAENN